MTEPSLKNQAQEIMVAVDRDLQQVESMPSALQAEVNAKADTLINTIFGAIHDVDIAAAVRRVQDLKEKYPDVTPPELAQKLIYEKCRRTGTVGAMTSSAGLIPGIGTATALVLGTAADIGVTFKMDAELVLEIATVYDYPLTENEKQQLVLLISGLSAGTSALALKAGRTASVKIGEKFAEKAIVKALPVIGVIASIGTNALSTYIIGQRADAYFRLGPDAVGNWTDSLRAISGVDERNLGEWLAEGSKATGAALVAGAGKVGEAGRAAGEAVVSGAGKVADTVGPAAKKVGGTARSGFKAYIRMYVNTWRTVLGIFGKILSFIWSGIMFIPRKIMGLFKRKVDHPNL